MKLLILGAVGEMCTPATKDLIHRGLFPEVTLTDINIGKLRQMAQELGVKKKMCYNLMPGTISALRN